MHPWDDPPVDGGLVIERGPLPAWSFVAALASMLGLIGALRMRALRPA